MIILVPWRLLTPTMTMTMQWEMTRRTASDHFRCQSNNLSPPFTPQFTTHNASNPVANHLLFRINQDRRVIIESNIPSIRSSGWIFRTNHHGSSDIASADLLRRGSRSNQVGRDRSSSLYYDDYFISWIDLLPSHQYCILSLFLPVLILHRHHTTQSSRGKSDPARSEVWELISQEFEKSSHLS